MKSFGDLKRFKNRAIDFDKPVEVYRNINKRAARTYSIRQRKLVVGHATRIGLSGCELLVSLSGQRRVRVEGRKNVHAVIKGVILKHEHRKGPVHISYNPFEDNCFQGTLGTDSFPVFRAEEIFIGRRGVWAKTVNQSKT